MSPTETQTTEDPPPPTGTTKEEEEYANDSFSVEFTGSPIREVRELPLDSSDISYLWSAMLGPRNLLEKTPLGFRWNIMLQEGLKCFPWAHRLPYYPLSKHGERLADRILKIVEGVLIGLPPQHNMGEPCYYVHPESWADYLQEMKRIISASVPFLLEKDETIPSLPRWGLHNNSRQAWICSDFEIIGVTFREDVENLLGYLFDKEILSLIPRVVDRVTFAPEITSTPQAFIHQTPHHMSIHPTPNIEDRNDSTRELIHQHVAQNMDPGAKVQTEGVGEIRKRQSEIPVNDPHTPPTLRTSEKKSVLGIFANTRNGEASEGSSSSNAGFPPGPPGGGPGEDPPPGGKPPNGGNGSFGFSTPNGPQKSMSALDRRQEPHFYVKLKSDSIPTWDGNEDTLARWILKMNHLAERS
ncbi:hypothetical protein M422DRAFT_248564 [Sphaerobolus stellatus SS14]|nr:hypothetical protein M422DRAFT_248564 [Sphaerobolus stellatus SS14]